jgi:hypothetical protein
VELSLPSGFSVVGSTAFAPSDLPAGSTGTESFTVRAGAKAGTFTIGATASGSVLGSMNPWRGFSAYNYTDAIGGSGTVSVTVAN